MNKTISIAALAIMFAVTAARAQQPWTGQPAAPERPRDEAGAILLFGYTMHDAAFRALPGVPNCCPQYENAQSARFAGGLKYTRHLDGRFSLTARLLYADYTATFEAREQTLGSLDGEEAMLTFEHSLEARVQTLALEPVLEFRLLPFLTLGAGLNAAALVEKRYSQQEYLAAPAHAVYADGTRYRNRASGEIPETPGAVLSVVVVAGAIIPVNQSGTLAVHPEVGYLYGITGISGDTGWRVHAIRAGLAIVAVF